MFGLTFIAIFVMKISRAAASLFSLSSRNSLLSLVLTVIYFLIFIRHARGRQKPSDGVLTQYLKKLLSLPTQGLVYLIIDALDECPNPTGMLTSREEVVDLIQDLVDFHLPNVHLCVTIRLEIDIQTALEPLASLCISLHNQSGQTKDIVDYVSSVAHSDKMIQRWREEDKSLVIKTLSERADGM